MYQNNLTQRYQNYLNQPIDFMNNQMLNNNPLYASNIHDQNFYQQMMLQREEQKRKIKNVSDLGMTREQITEYVIAPIKIERGDKAEIDRYTTEEENMMTKKFIEDNWWSKRTNEPYKNILKDEDWRKDFKKEEDLIVHKVTDLDKVGLMDDYEALIALIEVHDGELKVIFSSSKETEHKKAFKFVQKYKYRMKYDPKDYNDLKDYYKKEQKKFDKEQKRIDDVISRLMDDEMDEKELKRIESEFLKPSKTKKNKKEQDREFREIQEFIDEYGEDALNEILEDSDDDTAIKKSKKRPDKKMAKKTDKDCSNDYDDKNVKSSRIRIKNITIEEKEKHIKTKDTSKEHVPDVSQRRIRIKRIGTEEFTKNASEPENTKTDETDKKVRIRIKPKTHSKDADVKRVKEDKSVVTKVTPSTKNTENEDSTIKRIRIVRKT